MLIGLVPVHVLLMWYAVDTTGFSLSFKVDSQDLKVGNLAIEYCKQFQTFIPYFAPFSQNVQGPNLKVASF